MVKKVSSGTRLPSSNPGSSPNGYEILDESLNSSEPQFPIYQAGLVVTAGTGPSLFALDVKWATYGARAACHFPYSDHLSVLLAPGPAAAQPPPPTGVTVSLSVG